ncbi:hypothetical protein IPL68_00055 [Candidatus Saccharibacteria bacterium]|nr:MAG: hypothetical protein IPL68_00055 [Candidatus Saccharibacteria bacterium]
MPAWIRFIRWTRLDGVIGFFRRDRHYIPPGQRLSTLETLSYFDAQRRLRRKAYDSLKILDHGLFSIEDLTFNCIFIRANERLRDIARTLHHELPDDLQQHMEKSERALHELYDPYSKTYWSRDFITHRLLKQPSIAALMPLYAGVLTKEQAEHLVKQLENEHIFGPAFPVPSVPLDSPSLTPICTGKVQPGSTPTGSSSMVCGELATKTTPMHSPKPLSTWCAAAASPNILTPSLANPSVPKTSPGPPL